MPLEAVFSITASTLSAFTSVWKFLQIAIEIKGAPESAQVFVRLVLQVQQDLEHALACRHEVMNYLLSYPPHYNIWIRNAVKATMDELEDFGRFLDNDLEGKEIRQRVSFLLTKYPELAHRERGLRIAHSRLLQAIGTMHLIAIPMGPGLASLPARLSTPSVTTTPTGTLTPPPLVAESEHPLRRRASRRPPDYALSRPPSPQIDTPIIPSIQQPNDANIEDKGNVILEHMRKLDREFKT